ncbi:28S ribosomal protein S27, mitochondrial [Tetranychus urticae]|uniref:28S ribosomal protein S27, mitochondrial n=2 Tax=Tetranychus urticae TaxID=32264 RepID=T1K3L2_TETUR|nr:28S ribosomal protein S27, mitochondrial [Tetranychus urticae]
MIMSLFGFNRQFLRLGRLLHARTILSSSYACQEEWTKRLQEPVFAGVNADEFFFKMKERAKSKVPIEPIDVDIFANVSGHENLEECIYFLTLLRENRRTAFTLESTHHAVCRLFLNADAADKLLPILQDRLKYGVFPDNFAFNMIMDHFLEKSDFTSACKVAHLYMLQEDFSKLTNVLALYSVYGCLTDPAQKEALCKSEEKPVSEEEKDNQGDEDEVEYVRVPFVRNPHFDDHFDLKDPILLSGKTLYLIGLRYNGVIGLTSQLIGLALWKKWSLAQQLLEKVIADQPNSYFAKGTIELINDFVSSEPDAEETTFIEKLKSNENLMKGENIVELIKKEFNSLSELESKDCSLLKEKFLKWSDDRAKALQEQLEKYVREEKIKEIKERKKELELKERKLFFFENFNKIEMEYVEAKKKLDELKASEAEEEYFPPKR